MNPVFLNLETREPRNVMIQKIIPLTPGGYAVTKTQLKVDNECYFLNLRTACRRELISGKEIYWLYISLGIDFVSLSWVCR